MHPIRTYLGFIRTYVLGLFLLGLLCLPALAHAATVDHFRISYNPPYGPEPSSLVAGSYVYISIAAYEDAGETTVATWFTFPVDLKTSVDYAEPYRTISPQSVTLSNGIWTGHVAFFRQCTTGVRISCVYNTVPTSVSCQPIIYHGQRAKMVILAPGMTFRPGIAPNLYPMGGSPSTSGDPLPQETGKAFPLTVFLCDNYYNVITGTVQGANDHVEISCTDSTPATMGGTDLPQSVTLTADQTYAGGVYYHSQFKLYSVGTGQQTFSSQDTDGIGTVTFGMCSIPVHLPYTATPTVTVTPTITVTPTVTVTPSITMTSTAAPTQSPTCTPQPDSLGANTAKLINNRYFPHKSNDPIQIRVNQSNAGPVTINIYSTQGTLVCTLADHVETGAGTHVWTWSAQNTSGALVPSGIYVVHIQTPQVNQYLRAAVIK